MGNFEGNFEGSAISHPWLHRQFRGVGAHPWLLGRRHGPATGNYTRLVANDRVSGAQVHAESQRFLDTLISSGGYSAYQLVFGPNPVDLLGVGDEDEDLLFAQDTSFSGQFA